MERERKAKWPIRSSRSPGIWMVSGLLLLAMVALCAPAWANVYASGLVKTGDYSFTYILNENADTNVRIEVWTSDGATMVYSEDLGPQTKGTQSWTWTGAGGSAGNTYKVKVIPSDPGYAAWTQISTDATSTSFEYPMGISVYKDQGSAKFGTMYVSSGRVGTTVFGRACSDGIYRLKPDCTEDGLFTGGQAWVGNSAPWKSTIGPDGHLYVSDLSNDLAFEFNDDLSVATQLIDATNRTTNQWVGSVFVSGTGADRKLILANTNYNDTSRKGVIQYDLGTNTVMPSGNTGTQVIPASQFTYYPYDVSRDAAGNWYVNNMRAAAGQAPPLRRYNDGTFPLTTPAWSASSASPYFCSRGIDVLDSRNWAAYGTYSGVTDDAVRGWVRIYDKDTGTYLTGFDAGTNIQDIAFDAAGNVVTVDNTIEWMRVWSPPDGPNSFTTESYFTMEGFGTPRTLTVNVDPSGAGTTTGAGTYGNGQLVTVTAAFNDGYKFDKWTDSLGATLSTSESYSFSMPDADTTINAVFAATADRWLTVLASPAEGGTVGGGGWYLPGTEITPTATPTDSTWTFSKWSTQSDGSDTVTLPYTMPSTRATLYAIFVPTSYNLNLSVYPAAAGTVAGGGLVQRGTTANPQATANANYKFLYWSTAATGQAGVVSGKPSYTFTMPANDVTYYAIFAKALFADGFEAKASAAGTTGGALDANYTVGPNAGANGDLNDNPWFGPAPPNFNVTTTTGGVTSNSGSKFAGVYSTYMGCRQDVNIAYRCGGGSNMASNFYLDWYFYDPVGTGATANQYNDYASLCLWGAAALGTAPYAADFVDAAEINPLPLPSTKLALERLSIGASGTSNVAYYQYGIGDPVVWTDTTSPRFVGWHHARIAVGASNDVAFFVDDMATPAGTTTAAGGGFNSLELNCRPLASTNVAGYFDDISILVPGTQSIDRWATIGHFDNADQPTRMTTDYFVGSGVTETTVIPRVGATYNGKTWALCNGGVVNFNQIYGAVTTNGVSYLVTYINNPGAPITDADLTCGSDDGIKIWLNDVVVLENDIYRSCFQDVDWTGPLTLNTGINKLMVKVTQGTGDYKAEVKLTHTDGSPLTGLTFSPGDVNGPTGTIQINGGAASTGSPFVTLNLSATDDISGVAQMKFADEDFYNPGSPGTWTDPEAYNTSKAWLLPGLNGTKVVFVKFIDASGNESIAYSASIEMAVDGFAVYLENCDPNAGTVAGASTYPTGSSVTVTATAKTGYTFANWTLDGCGGYSVASTNPNYTFTMPAWDVQLYANWVANTYTLTTHANTGGTVGGDSGSKTAGQACVVTATPTDPAQYAFKSWSTDSGGTVVVSTDASYSFNMPTNNYELWANFEYRPLLTVSNGSAHGTLGGDPSGHYDYNSSRTVSAVADSGWRLYGWSTDAAGANMVYYQPFATDSYTFTMPATDLTLYAQYALADLIFKDSFENGISQWTVTNGVPAIVDTQANVGTHSIVIHGWPDRVTHPIAPELAISANVGIRYWMRDSGQALAKGFSCHMQAMTDTVGTMVLGLGNYNAGGLVAGSTEYEFRAYNSVVEGSAWKMLPAGPVTTRVTSTAAPYPASWHRCDISYDGNAGATVKYYIDGVLVRTVSDVAASAIDTIVMGQGGSGTATLEPWYFDDFALFNSPKLLTTGAYSGIGTVSGAIEGNTVLASAGGLYYAGENLTLTASGSSGPFVRWVDAGGTEVSTANPYSFQMPSSDTTIKAVFLEDTTPPTGSIVIDGGAASTGTTSVTLTLSATDADSGMGFMKFSNDGVTYTEYEAYGTSKAWTLTSGDGEKTVYVIFKDNAGNESTAYSDTITLTSCSVPGVFTPLAKISDIWPLANDLTVYKLAGKTVTAVWTDGFWIEEANRSAGVKVVTAGSCTIGSAVAAGASVDVYGTLTTVDERLFNATVIVNNGAGTAVQPVIVTEKYSGGKGVNVSTPAVTGGKGIYGVGLLVKIAGSLSQTGSDWYLDDGSGLLDGTIKGMKVFSLTTPTAGSRMVTGVIGVIAGKPVIYATNIQ